MIAVIYSDRNIAKYISFKSISKSGFSSACDIVSDTFEFVGGKQFVAIFDLLFALTIVALIED